MAAVIPSDQQPHSRAASAEQPLHRLSRRAVLRTGARAALAVATTGMLPRATQAAVPPMSRWPRWPRLLPVLALALGCLVAGAATAKAGGAQAPPAAAQVTPLLVSATNAPLTVLGSDGREHLEYDLVFTNGFTAPVILTAIQVFGPDGSELLRLDGDALVANTRPIYGGDPSAVVPVSGTVATTVDIALAANDIPAQITHRISFDLPTDALWTSFIGSRTLDGPSLTVDPRAPVSIGPPLRGDGWINGNGCCAPESIHRWLRQAAGGSQLNKIEMFAIDWSQLQNGRPFSGDGSLNEQWFDFGADVLSVAPGTVVSARDGMPDQPLDQPPSGLLQTADYAGNSVVVQIAPTAWAFYLHLKQGSVQVRVGDQVTAGQRLGALGNSGNSLGPHLHFQLSDGPDSFTSTSLPFVIDHYTLAGTANPAAVTAMVATSPEEDGPDIGTGGTVIPVEGTPQAQTDTYPLFFTVQDFP